MATKTRLTLDEFLCLPETEPASEYIDGEVVQKMSPSWYHIALVHYLDRVLGNYLHDNPGEGRGGPELRHAVHQPRERSFLPDISIMRLANIPRDPATRRRGPVPAPPDFAIEVLSPGDQPGRVLERADFYMRIGTELLWIVDPELEAITVYRPGEPPVVHRAPAHLDAMPVLAEFSLDLAALFATLHDGEDPDPDTG